ncbi:MAG TPA: hypothetical protein VHG09_03190 [Longimicrobiales bacterium]|nr:hypothetical protein [Longimicrobiales bacterium]
MAVLIASYLLLVFVLPLALSAIVSYRALPKCRDCPHCGVSTLRLLSRPLRMASRLHPRSELHRRWCMECGWEGAARVPRVRRRRKDAEGPVQTVTTVRRATQTLDVRSLDVDGAPWRVMLQCWGNTGVFYGRLVFVGPSGRLWLDAVESFSGSNQSDVLGQALSLPEPLLESRLRRLVTDN